MAGSNYMGNMTFGVNFKVDAKALEKLDTQFARMENELDALLRKGQNANDNGLVKTATTAKKAYDELYSAMIKAYNPKLGQFDLSKINTALQSAKTNITQVATALNNAGQNVNLIMSNLLGNKLMIKDTNKFLDKMAVTFGNTVRWQITNKIINTITGSIQKAFYFVKDLDTSLNDIRIVTGKSADEMERFAKQATAAAQALGKTTTDYTKASLLYYQQGLSDKEVAARAQTTLKAANVTGQSTSEVSEQLTAVWNGYKVNAAETEKYVDKLSAVAASTASNLEELSTGMSKVASAANMMGVDVDQLNAQLSTVISVTRQAPETIGAAFKTIYSRMSTIKAGGIDEEDGATLTSYSEKMNNFGFSVLDANGKLRDMGEVIEEIGNKWETLTREQQVGLAQAMGGTRQYSNLTALFENWDKYQTALQTSQNATGTLEKQQEIYMDSIAAHFEQLTAEAEKFYQAILDEDVLKDVADGLKFIVQQLNAIVQGLGGGKNALIAFASAATNLFSNKIGTSLGAAMYNRQEYKISQQNVDTKAAVAQFYSYNNRDALTNKNQRKIYDDLKEKEEADRQKILQQQFFNPNASIATNVNQTPLEAIGQANKNQQVFVSGQILEGQAKNEANLLSVVQQIGEAKYNELTADNEQLTILKAQAENYDIVNTKVQEFLNSEEAAKLDIKEVGQIQYEMEKTTTEELKQQLEVQEKILQEKQGVYTKAVDDNNQAHAETQRLQIGVNTMSQLLSEGKKYKNIDTSTLFTKEGKTRVAAAGELKNIQQYYKDLNQRAATYVDLTDKQKDAFKRLNEGITNNTIKEKEFKAIMEELGPIQDQLNNKQKEYNKDLTAAKNAEKKAIKAQQTAKEVVDNQVGVVKEHQGYVDRREIIGNQFDNLAPQIKGLAEGQTDEIARYIRVLEDKIRAGFNQGNQQKSSINLIRGLTGTIRAANAAVGGLTTMFDDANTSMEKANGLITGFWGTLAGAASIANPALGMAVSLGGELVKTLGDSLGITKLISNAFKNQADNFQEYRDEIHKCNKELNDATQKINDYNNKNKEFHNNIKSLEDMQSAWENIIAKQRAGIALTEEEKTQYQSMADKILELNDGITYTYDKQHNLIISNNNALQDTIDKLNQEKALRESIEQQEILRNARLAYQEAQSQKERYEQAQKDLVENSNSIEKAQALYNQITTQLNEKKILNYNMNTGFNSLETDTVSDVGQTYYQDLKYIFSEEGWENFAKRLSQDEDKTWQKSILEKITKLEDNTSEGDFMNYLSIGNRVFGSDLHDIMENLMEYDLVSIGNMVSDSLDPAIDEFNQAAKGISTAMQQMFSTDFALQYQSSGSTIIDQIVSNYADTLFKNNVGADDDYILASEQIIKSSKTYANSLLKNANIIDKVSEQIASINLKQSNMSIEEYISAMQLIEQQLINAGITDPDVLNALFGKGNYGQDLQDKLNFRERTVITSGTGSTYNKYREVGEEYSTLTGTDLDEVRALYGPQDRANILNFMKEVLDDPDRYAEYGKDFVSQFDGYMKEKFNGKLFKDFLSEMNNDLDTIKQSALSGNELDEETFEKLSTYLSKYKAQLSDVSTETQIVLDKELYGSQAWIESLRRVEAQLEKVQEHILLEDRHNLALDILINADTTEADEAIEDLINQDYKVIVDIEAQGADSYNTAVTDLENLRKTLSYVGEDGKVAAENVLDLLNAFPELNDMVQNSINNDGTISLTKEQISLIRERTQVDIAGIVATGEMELKTQLLRAEREQKLTEAQIQMVEEELENFSDTQEAKEEFVERFSALYGQYSDGQVEITETNNDIINTDTWETADAITDYWVDAYANANTAYLDYVKNVMEGNKALQNLPNNFNPDNTITNSGIRQQKLNGSSATLSQDILDRVNQSKDEGAYKKALEESLAALKSKYQLNKKVTEELKNEMLALNVQGLQEIDNADKVGKKTKEAAWEAKHLYDYYHDINKELDFINQKLTILQKKQKLLEGKALLKNLKAQTKEYQNQLKYLQQKRGIQDAYQKELQTRMTDELGNKSLAAYGVTFDKNGYIENYAEIASTLQRAQHDKESVEDYQNFINQVKTYEENLQLALDLEGQLYDVIAKRQELQSQAVEEKIKMILDVSEAYKQYMEFTKELGNFEVNLILNPDQTAIDAAAAQAAEQFVESSITAMEKNTKMVTEGNSKINELLGKKTGIEQELAGLQEGGSVNLLLRPEIDTSELIQAGYDAGEGVATVFSHTFTNATEDVAVNFTPIIVDPKTGEYKGVMDSKEFQSYCESVIDGAEDYLHLQIGGEFSSIEEAEDAAIRIHELHDELSNAHVEFNGMNYYTEDLLKLEDHVDQFADAARQSAADIQQAYQSTIDSYSNAMKELNEWDKRVLARYDMVSSVFDQAEKLTELWYGKDSLEAQMMLTSIQRDRTNNLYEKAKEANEQVRQDWEIYQDAVTQGNEKLASEAYDAWAESMQNLQNLSTQYAEQRQQQLMDELNLAHKIVETQLYGGKTYEEFSNSWELLNKQAEIYLDTINAQFGVTQLENKYVQAINKTIGNTKGQEKINKIMNEEMKMLKEKDKLTKYDLERAEAKYELTLKQIALEEARENKTNLRLRRDSQGNYSYQYTANEDDIAKAQAEVDIAKNNLYNMDRNRYQDLSQQEMDAQKEYADKYNDIMLQYANDDKARLEKLAELYEAYLGENGVITRIATERGVAYLNLGESIDESLNGTGEGSILGSFEKLKQKLPKEVNSLATALEPSIKNVIDKWADPNTGIASAYKTLDDSTQQFFTKYEKDIAQFATDLDQNTTFGKVRDTFNTVKTKVDEFELSAQNATTAIGKLNEISSEFSLDTLLEDFEQLIKDLGGENDDGLIARIKLANQQLQELVKPDEKLENWKKIREALAKIRTTLENNKKKFDWALDEIKNWKEAVINHAKDAKSEIGTVADELNSLKNKKVTVTVETVYTTKGSPTKESGSGSSGSTTQGLGEDGDNGDDKKHEYQGSHYNIYYNDTPIYTSGSASEGQKQLVFLKSKLSKFKDYEDDKLELKTEKQMVSPKDLYITDYVANEGQFYEAHQYYFKTPADSPYNHVKKNKKLSEVMTSLDTGGYTGVWGDQGKLAMLHEKELVLNKDDTRNILEAVDIMRKIDKQILEYKMFDSLEAYKQQMTVSTIASSGQATAINQTITINADFPDATDRDEIKAAFDSLVNLATQRAFTKKY